MRRKIGEFKNIKRKEKIDKNRQNKWWPTIFCLNEKLFIGVSLCTMKMIAEKPIYKVNKIHWKKDNSKFREEQYRINMENLIDGQQVFCPKCNMPVDFRLWKSATEPNFVSLQIEDIIKDRESGLS